MTTKNNIIISLLRDNINELTDEIENSVEYTTMLQYKQIYENSFEYLSYVKYNMLVKRLPAYKLRQDLKNDLKYTKLN